MRFTVISQRSRIPANSRSRAFLITDDWDDWFKFSTLYFLIVCDENGVEIEVGGVKIGEFGMEEGQRRPNLPKDFESLGEEFFSLGQDDSYYEELNKLSPEGRDEILRGLKDVAM